ncbi:hypothetical protein Ae406Ps2_3756c [Pseudonocardia sp. Ae406_Ps2]|nr:hypothetical protein Ae331Ps2_2183 [Pseudonocardia sp. Ae331_Ps2]OLM03756.1 hypothetical protein Ae406Ps2_3756c [Pseudonocardia sp. Ae406_Ps2]
MQRLGALQKDYDLTVGVPALVGEFFRHVRREGSDDPVLVARHPVEIAGAEQNGVPVGRQLATSGELLDVVLGFPQQCLCDFLWDDTASEDPREGVAHEPLKSALEAVHAAQKISSIRIGVSVMCDRSYLCYPPGPAGPGTSG